MHCHDVGADHRSPLPLGWEKRTPRKRADTVRLDTMGAFIS